jgi:hypothetical protein
MRWRIVIYGLLAILVGSLLYLKSNYRKLPLTDHIYQELHHPDWSTRIVRTKAVLPNLGSGDHKMLYLMDARRVTIPIEDAIAFYEKETDRLGFRECHVDSFARAREKFQWDWDQLGVTIPSGGDVVVISQNFTSDSTIRRHKPAEQAVGGNGGQAR